VDVSFLVLTISLVVIIVVPGSCLVWNPAAVRLHTMFLSSQRCNNISDHDSLFAQPFQFIIHTNYPLVQILMTYSLRINQ
jgi:hypothetical protein